MVPSDNKLLVGVILIQTLAYIGGECKGLMFDCTKWLQKHY